MDLKNHQEARYAVSSGLEKSNSQLVCFLVSAKCNQRP
nr:MAG TPA: hypothetical protein [Caudoviricetes sp.]